MPDPVLIRLTQAELQLLLRTLDIETLPGIAADLLPDFNEEQRKMALAVAGQTLRARRFVGWSSDLQQVINPAVANLLLDSAHPTTTLFVDTGVPTGRSLPFLYVCGEHGISEQCQPEPDVLQFRVLSSSEELEQRLSPRFAEERVPQPECWQGRIKQNVLNGVLRLVGQNEDAARRALEAVLPLELAEALASAYHAPRAVQYIACWQHVPTTEHSEPWAALTIVQGEAHTFLLWAEEPELGETACVCVTLFSADTLHQYVKQLIAPFIGATL